MSVSPEERKLVLGQLSTVADRDLRTLWRLAEQLPSSEFAAFVAQAFGDVATPYVSAASSLSADWYEQSAPQNAFRTVDAPLTPPQALESSAQWALNVSIGRSALELLSGTLQRAIFNGARDTTLANVERERGARWARHASANACEFCRMLATRGAVYSSSESASSVVGRRAGLTAGDRRAIASGSLTVDDAYANRETYSSAAAARRAGKSVGDSKTRNLRGSGSHGGKYHDHCHCVAVEVRPGGASYEPAPYVQDWEKQYQAARKTAGSGDPKQILAAWRQLETSQS